MDKYMEFAIKEAKKAYRRGDVPVGAVVVCDGKVIAKSYNKKQNKNVATRHAEIEVIEKACKKRKNWYLDDCEIYITMEPCLMCTGAIIQSRIKKIVYGVENEKFGCIKSIEKIFENEKINHKPEIIGGIMSWEIEKMLKDFFKGMRNK